MASRLCSGIAVAIAATLGSAPKTVWAWPPVDLVEIGTDYTQNPSGGYTITVWFRAYDPPQDEWVEDSVSFSTSSEGEEYAIDHLTAIDGVVSWTSVYKLASWTGWTSRTVWYAAYDPSLGRWRQGNTVYSGEAHVIPIFSDLKVGDGVVAWIIPDYDPEWNPPAYWVGYVIYDPTAKAWRGNGFGDYYQSVSPSALAIADATVSYQVDGSSMVRGYDFFSGVGWYNGPTYPLAHFAAAIPSGDPPFHVWFYDMSIAATSWFWEFHTCGTSSQRMPLFTFDQAGRYIIRQSVTGPAGSHSKLDVVNLCGDDVPSVLYVDASAGTGCGGCASNWEEANVDLQDALALASNFPGVISEIRVAAGVYRPDRGAGDRSSSFELPNQVKLYGGFPAGGGTWEERDPNVHLAILSGDLSGNDVEVTNPSDLLAEPTRAENSYHVVTANGTDSTALLDGFVVTGGQADGASWQYTEGAGLRVQDGSPTVVRCKFQANAASNNGGGVYLTRSTPDIRDCQFIRNCAHGGGAVFAWEGSSASLRRCVFSANAATNCGGGINCNNLSHLTMTDCALIGNWAISGGGGLGSWGGSNPILHQCDFIGNGASFGGGVKCDFSSPTITDCSFDSNVASETGGGMFVGLESESSLTTCVFVGNQAQWGGAMLNGSSNPSLVNCEFVQNQATGGGAIHNAWSDPRLINCLFSNNCAVSDGGAIRNKVSSGPLLSNCTLSNNVAGTNGGAMVSLEANGNSPILINCILWSNSAPNGPECCGPVAAMYSCLKDWSGGGEGNIIADPMFVDADGPDDDPNTWQDNNYHLSLDSPCINRGDPNLEADPNNFDMDGDPRVVHGRVDIGADEYTDALPPSRPALVATDARPNGTWPKTQNNFLRLSFDMPIALPGGYPLSVVELGDPNSDVSSAFTYQIDPDDPNGQTLKGSENGAMWTNQTWYRVTPAAGLDVHLFEVDVCTLTGDADGSRRVTTADYSAVKVNLGERTGVRCDLNGSGRVTTADYSVVKAHLGDVAPAKP